MLVAELLHEQKYSLQVNRKTKEGSSRLDRNAQFEYINAKATEFLKLPSGGDNRRRRGAVGGGTDVVTVTDSLGNTATVQIHVGAALSATASTTTSPPITCPSS